MVFVICSFASAYRYSQIFHLPFAMGDFKVSPSGQYTAYVYDYDDEDFWGHKTSWYEFRIIAGEITGMSRESEQIVLRHLKTDPIEGPNLHQRFSDQVIFWAPDSSEVKFVFPDTQIILQP